MSVNVTVIEQNQDINIEVSKQEVEINISIDQVATATAVQASIEAKEARDEAEISATNALISAQNALASEQNALESANLAEVYRDETLLAKDSSQEFASQSIDARNEAVEAKDEAIQAKDDVILLASQVEENATLAEQSKELAIEAKDEAVEAKNEAIALLGSLDNYQLLSEKGVSNGYASLDSNAKIPLTQINDALLGNVNFQGLWDAFNNTPTLQNPPSLLTKGNYYIVSTIGSFAGIDFQVGDWIISNGTTWDKVNNTDAVSTVFGRTGNITSQANDYNAFYVRHDLSNQGLNSTQQLNARTNIGAGTGNIEGSINTGQVAFGLSSNNIAGDNELFWNNTNKRLGIGTNNPQVLLDLRYNTGSFTRGITLRNNSTDSFAFVGILLQDSNGIGRASFDYYPSNFVVSSLANTVAFVSANQSRLGFIANSGSIGEIAQDIYFSTLGSNTTFQLQIKGNTGNVQIGTNSDSGDRLRVNGRVRIDSVTNATGDIVTIDANNVLRRRTSIQLRNDINVDSNLIQNLGNISGTVNINLDLGTLITATLTGTTTLTFSGLPPTTRETQFKLRFSGNQTINFPSGTLYPSGIQPTTFGVLYELSCSINSSGQLIVYNSINDIRS
jgi:hypothetical protein